MAKKESNSRPARWARALEQAQRGADEMRAAFSDLQDLQSEYQDWRDNLPESLQSSALADKLDAVCDLDLDIDDALATVLDDAESVDLPLGFGRD